MKKLPLIIMGVSVLCIIVSEALVLLTNSLYAHKLFAISFAGLGIGAILLGILLIVNYKSNKK